MRDLRHFGIAVASVFVFIGTSVVASAAPGAAIDGEYDCDECHGFLTIHRANLSEVRVALAVGGGNCGGAEPPVTGKVRDIGGVLKLPYKIGRKQCVVKIEMTGQGAFVADSCVTPQQEEQSTCAWLGSYTKRKK